GEMGEDSGVVVRRKRDMDPSSTWRGGPIRVGPARALSDLVAGADRLLVVGGPGQGKSTLSLQVAGTLARAWLGLDGGGGLTPEAVLPLRVTARGLAARISRPWPRALAEAATAELGAHGDLL